MSTYQDTCPNCGEVVTGPKCGFCGINLIRCACGLVLPASTEQCPYCHRLINNEGQLATRYTPVSRSASSLSSEDNTTDRIVHLEAGQDAPIESVSEPVAQNERMLEKPRVAYVSESDDSSGDICWRSVVSASAVVPIIALTAFIFLLADEHGLGGHLWDRYSVQILLVVGLSVVWLIVAAVASIKEPREW